MKVMICIPIYKPQSSFTDEIVPLLQRQTICLNLLVINSSQEEIKIKTCEMIHIDQHTFNHANTRNIALNYEADFYLFMTQDAMPCDERLVEKLLKAFDDPDVMVAYARQIPYVDADAIERFARGTNYPSVSKIKSKKDLAELSIKTFFCSDSCAMYRASYFKHVGGFKKDINTSEDMEFAARAIMDDRKVAYVAEAKVYHSHTFTCKDIWKRYQAIGKFFRENKWIQDAASQYVKVESTGIQQALAELKYLWAHSPRDIPRSVVCSLVKYAAIKLLK